jgi:hypothetical protein
MRPEEFAVGVQFKTPSGGTETVEIVTRGGSVYTDVPKVEDGFLNDSTYAKQCNLISKPVTSKTK